MKVSGSQIALTIALYASLVFVSIKLTAIVISGVATLIMGLIQ